MTTSPTRRDFLRTCPHLVAGASLAVGLTSHIPFAQAQPGATKRPPIKVGQIGVQHAHASKLSVYRASSDYEVVGVVEPDADAWGRAQKQAAFRDLPRMTEEQLLAVPGMDAVLVESQVRDLIAIAQRCIDCCCESFYTVAGWARCSKSTRLSAKSSAGANALSWQSSPAVLCSSWVAT